jgi:hypothetical protein
VISLEAFAAAQLSIANLLRHTYDAVKLAEMSLATTEMDYNCPCGVKDDERNVLVRDELNLLFGREQCSARRSTAAKQENLLGLANIRKGKNKCQSTTSF